MSQDRRRFLKYRQEELTAMEKFLLDQDRTLRYGERPMQKDAPVVLPHYFERYN